MSTNNKHGLTRHITQSARHGYAISPSDTVDLPAETRAIYVGTTGDLAVVHADDLDGTIVLYKNLAAGVYHGIAAKRVMAANTTATDLVAGW